jgi:anaerobic magnesium-protoporphyrin IX monomethyl ester cyclase
LEKMRGLQRNTMDRSVILINYPVYIDFSSRLRAPIGLLYLGAVLKDNGIPTKVFDFQTEQSSWSDVEKAITDVDRCLVGFSCDSENLHRVLHLSDRLLSCHSNLKIVLGGPHVTHIWKSFVSNRRIIVRGEGEYALLLLAKHFLYDEGELHDIPGIVYCLEDKIHVNPLSLGPYEDVNSIPFPDYSLLHTKHDYYPSIITGRGCSYQCFFCSEGNENRTFRPRSIENIEEELLHLKKYNDRNVSYLSFADDTFTVSAQRVNKICDVLDKVFPDKSRFCFFCEGRVNILAKHPELIYRLKEAGLVRIQIGIESSNQGILNKINKNIRVEQVEKVISTCNDADIPAIVGVFMCGLPDQTEQDVKNDIEFAKHLADLAPGRLELFMVPLALLPGTEFRNKASEWGFSSLDDDFVTGGILDDCFIRTATLSKEQIKQLCRLFSSEVERYLLEKAAFLSPQRIKELFILRADRHMSPFVVKKLSFFDHVRSLLLLRRREDRRFLFELSDEAIPLCSPLRIMNNTVNSSSDSFIINEKSPMWFELTSEEKGYYDYFSGKLSFKEIAQRLAGKSGQTENRILEECLKVYRKCEDKLAAIVVI